MKRYFLSCGFHLNGIWLALMVEKLTELSTRFYDYQPLRSRLILWWMTVQGSKILGQAPPLA
jgi:hypothetical protein